MAMVTLKTSKELAKMRKAGAIAAQALQAGGAAIRPGVTTGEVDRAIKRFIVSKGAKPSFLGYGGFPGSACISVNEEVIHGIPGKRILREGDIVSIDVGALYDGYHGDTAATFAVGAVDTQAQTLMDATRESLQAALAVMRVGARIGDSPMWRNAGSAWCTNMSGMASAGTCTRPRRCPTTGVRDMGCGWSRAWCSRWSR